MENTATPIVSKFQFVKYLITDAGIKLTGKKCDYVMSCKMTPRGEFIAPDTFVMTMDVKVNDKGDNIAINMTIQGHFKYETANMEEMRSYLGMNAPAILFPYIRSYVTNITALSGITPIIMPTMNMQSIGDMLLKNIKDASPAS